MLFGVVTTPTSRSKLDRANQSNLHPLLAIASPLQVGRLCHQWLPSFPRSEDLDVMLTLIAYCAVSIRLMCN